MIYGCTNDFELPLVDDDGFTTEEMRLVASGTLWEIEEGSAYTLTGAEIRLITLDDEMSLSWIEISRERLESNFEIRVE